jgi:hypothetical protein
VTLVRVARGEVKSTYRSVREEIVAVDEVNKIRGTDNVHPRHALRERPDEPLLAVTMRRRTSPAWRTTTAGKVVS